MDYANALLLVDFEAEQKRKLQEEKAAAARRERRQRESLADQQRYERHVAAFEASMEATTGPSLPSSDAFGPDALHDKYAANGRAANDPWYPLARISRPGASYSELWQGREATHLWVSQQVRASAEQDDAAEDAELEAEAISIQ